jgi:hypothetical protein
MSDISTVDQRPMPGGGANKPSSGTYGEKADTERLKQSLPSSGAPAPGGQPLPQMSPAPISPTQEYGGRPVGPTAPPGVPPAIMHPTARPDVPMSTPLAGDPLNQQALPPNDAHFEGRLRTIDTLIQSNRVSPQTREWLEILRAVLIGGDPTGA